MDKLRLWLSRKTNQKNIPVDQFVILLNELDSKAISVKGAGIFPITYSFNANVKL